DQLHAGEQVAPLVVAAGLQGAAVAAVQLQEVHALQDLVAELGEADALVTGQAPGHGVLGEHGAQAEVFADLTQHVDCGEVFGPVEVVHQQGRVLPVEVEELGNLGVQPARPVGHDLLGVQVTFPGHTRVTDHAGRTAHQGDRPVPGALQVPQQHQLHEVSVMQAGGGGIEAAIVGDRPTVESV